MPLRRTTTFTIHALDRVAERLHLSTVEIASILDEGCAVNLGVDSYSNRQRRLFYSRVDEQFFVAVQDMNTGDVITVLPLEYYANLHGYVKEQTAVEAAALVGSQPTDVWRLRGVMPTPTPGTNSGASVVRISGRIRQDGGTRKIKNLGSWPSTEAPAELVELVRAPGFLDEIRRRAREKGIELSPPFELRLQMGNKGEPVCVEIERWPEANASRTEPLSIAANVSRERTAKEVRDENSSGAGRIGAVLFDASDAGRGSRTTVRESVRAELDRESL